MLLQLAALEVLAPARARALQHSMGRTEEAVVEVWAVCRQRANSDLMHSLY